MNIPNLYSDSDIQTMKFADNAIVPGDNRVEEIRKFAKEAGFQRIGIANCISMQKEAEALKEMLSTDFEMVNVNCKIDRIPNSEILGADAKGISCNPAGQAKNLVDAKTELNITLGLCVGHEIVFNAKSKVPTTALIVKDRIHKHNTIEIFRKTA